MDDAAATAADRLSDHWWGRPGWTPGRMVDTWHATFDVATELHDLVDRLQGRLRALPGLDLVPTRWLHMTIQAIGWTDELDATAIDRCIAATSAELADVSVLPLTVGPCVVKGEGVVLPVEPRSQLVDIQRRIQDAIRSATGAPAPVANEQRQGFFPHISIAYSHVDRAAREYQVAVDAVRPGTASVMLGDVALIRQDRQLTPARLYRWSELARAPLAGESRSSAPHLPGVVS